MNAPFKFPRTLRQASSVQGFAAVVVGVIALLAWSFCGTRLTSFLAPALKSELALNSPSYPLDVWIMPPGRSHAPPEIISTPAGVRFENDTLVVARDSVLSAHLAEPDGDTPELIVNGDAKEFSVDAHGDFSATVPLISAANVSIRRGWRTLASWSIRVASDSPPQAAITELPSIGESNALRLAYQASDDLGITEVALRVTAHNALPGANQAPVEIPLPAPMAKQISRAVSIDLTSRPWAGQVVTIQIVATNQEGRQGVSQPIDFTLPESAFFHPVARVLIEERKKLMREPDSERLREETASIMAGIAREFTGYRSDPVILMALRSGAVRLILDHGHEAAVSVNDLLWQAAVRIEKGAESTTLQPQPAQQQDLACLFFKNQQKPGNALGGH